VVEIAVIHILTGLTKRNDGSDKEPELLSFKKRKISADSSGRLLAHSTCLPFRCNVNFLNRATQAITSNIPVTEHVAAASLTTIFSQPTNFDLRHCSVTSYMQMTLICKYHGSNAHFMAFPNKSICLETSQLVSFSVSFASAFSESSSSRESF
jgi:hypothetical protein